MIDPNKKEPLSVSPSDVCYRAFELMHEKHYDEAEKYLSATMAKTDDDTAIALYHSALGVLFKLKGEYKAAWKHYQRAEKLLPNDPALKIISARLLLEQFSEYGQAIKKAKRVLELIPDNPVFAHQAYTTMGLAQMKKGDRKKAVEMLDASAQNDFNGFVSAKNISFELVEALLKRSIGVESCRHFLERALQFAQSTSEEQFIELYQRMLATFGEEYPPQEYEITDPGSISRSGL